MKNFVWALALGFACCIGASANADLILTGVIDGDLPGGIPKAVVVRAEADIADMSIYGVGSANNGGGTDGEEFNFGTDGGLTTATVGDVFIIVSNGDGADFFNNNFSGLNVFTDGMASINGDDAIELFQSGAVIDTYGDIDVDGNGETWEYVDGYGIRTGGAAGAFDQANWNSVNLGFDGEDEATHVTIITAAFGFTPAVPEPATAVLFGLAGLGLCVVRRR